MRFPLTFKRKKPAGSGLAALGADTAPPNTPYPQDQKPIPNDPGGGAALLATRMISVSGWPPHRIAVICRYIGAAGTPKPINVQAYFFEDQTMGWFPLAAAVKSLQPNGAPVFFDTIVPVEYANVQANQDNPNPGNINILIVASDPGGMDAADNGTYVFAVTVDQTTA